MNPVLKGKARSELSKAVWRRRKREKAYKALCAFCHRPIWARGVKAEGKAWHKGCYEAFRVGLKPEHIGRNPEKSFLGLHEAVIRDIKAAKKMVPLGYTQIKQSDAEYIAKKYNLPVGVIMRASKYLNPRRLAMRREPRDAYRFYGARALNPRAKCPKCGKFMQIRETVSMGPGYSEWEYPYQYYCSHCKKYFSSTKVKEFNPREVKYGHIDQITRPEVSRRTWAARRRAGGYGICQYCGEPIFAGGVRYKGKLYHETCASLKRRGVPARVMRNPIPITPGDVVNWEGNLMRVLGARRFGDIIELKLMGPIYAPRSEQHTVYIDKKEVKLISGRPRKVLPWELTYNPQETRPPREWFAKMLPGLRASYPKATKARLGRIASGIWWKFTPAQREAFRKRRELPSGFAPVAANPGAYVRSSNGIPLNEAGNPLLSGERYLGRRKRGVSPVEARRRGWLNPITTWKYEVIDRATGKSLRSGKVKARDFDDAMGKAMVKEGVTHPWDISLERFK